MSQVRPPADTNAMLGVCGMMFGSTLAGSRIWINRHKAGDTLQSTTIAQLDARMERTAKSPPQNFWR